MNKQQIMACVCDLKGRVEALESQPDNDNQVLSLTGNILSITGGNSVDLSQFLDDTDEQVISATLSGTNLILTISNGNTVNVPLASIDTDDQLLGLSGSNLSIQDGNTVDLSPFLDNTDDQQLSVSGYDVILENGGSVKILPTTQTIYPVVGGIIMSANGAIITTYGPITAVDSGRITWNSSVPIHTISQIGVENDSNLQRDNPKVTISNTFLPGDTSGVIMITVDDNGGAADVVTDTGAGAILNFHAEVSVVTDINITLN